MYQDLIFAPMGALALLTFAVLSTATARRRSSTPAGRVTAEDFRFGESPTVPGEVSIPNRNYMNLLELPTLFFAVCLMFYVAGRVDLAALVTAWTFVGLRVAHSVVHLTYNNVMHRLSAFAASNVALGILWVMFFVKYP